MLKTSLLRTSALLGLAWAGAALAQPGAVSIPDRLNAYVAFAPIDDGSYNVVVLSPKHDPAIQHSKPLDFCAADAGYATIRNVEKQPYQDEMASVLGCWENSGAADPLAEAATISVKFFSPSSHSVRQFTLNGSQLKPMQFDWRTEKLYAPSLSR